MQSKAHNHLRWNDVPSEQLSPLLQRQYISGTQTTVAHIHLKAGCIVPTHSHPNEQISTMISGSLRFTLYPEGEPVQVTVMPGELLVIPPNLPHSAEALEDTLNMDIFSPRREDWISGSDAYLRESASPAK